MHDRWYCSPYANSIAFQIHEALPYVRVEQIRQVEQNQGRVLSRVSGLMLLLTIASLLASALAVSAVMASTIIERRQEVGLMKSLGAGNGVVASLFFTEAGVLAIGAVPIVAGAIPVIAAGALIPGAAATAIGYNFARGHRQTVERIQLTLEQLLDRLEHHQLREEEAGFLGELIIDDPLFIEPSTLRRIEILVGED